MLLSIREERREMSTQTYNVARMLGKIQGAIDFMNAVLDKKIELNADALTNDDVVPVFNAYIDSIYQELKTMELDEDIMAMINSVLSKPVLKMEREVDN